MTDIALQSYVDKWLRAHPWGHQALSFIAPPQRPSLLAMAALEQEWVDAAYGIREPEVAAAKLNWWAEEISGAAASGGRHPVVRALFADPRAERIRPQAWVQPMLAAIAQLDMATPADFSGQMDAATPFHAALARLETAWWFGPDADARRAARMSTLTHLLTALTHLERPTSGDALVLPMARLARHGLDRDTLSRDTEARRRAVRDQLHDIAAAYRKAWQQPGPLSVFRGLDARLGQRAARRVPGGREPVSAVSGMLNRGGSLGGLFAAWAAARDWQRRDVREPGRQDSSE